MKNKGMKISLVSTSSDGFLGFLLFSERTHFFHSKGWLSFYSVDCFLTPVPPVGKELGKERGR